MITTITERVKVYGGAKVQHGRSMLKKIKEILSNEINIEESPKILASERIKVNSDYRLAEEWFSRAMLKDEIRANLMLCNDELLLRKYLHYLIKVYGEIRIGFGRVSDYREISEIKKQYTIPGKQIYESNIPGDSFYMLIFDCCNYLFEGCTIGSMFRDIVCSEFGIEQKDWENFTYSNLTGNSGKEIKCFNPPYLKEVGKFFTPKNELDKDSNNIQETKGKDKLSHKQQIILLDRLGIFKSDTIKNLNETQKGKLFGYLLNRNESNTEDYIRYLNIAKHDVPKDAYFVKTPDNLKKVNDLLKELGLDNI